MSELDLLKEINTYKIKDLDLGEGFILPKYLDQSILNVPSSICNLLDIPPLNSPPLRKEYLSVLGEEIENVICILVDAMAYHRLRAWMDEDDSLIWNQFKDKGVFAPITSISHRPLLPIAPIRSAPRPLPRAALSGASVAPVSPSRSPQEQTVGRRPPTSQPTDPRPSVQVVNPPRRGHLLIAHNLARTADDTPVNLCGLAIVMFVPARERLAELITDRLVVRRNSHEHGIALAPPGVGLIAFERERQPNDGRADEYDYSILNRTAFLMCGTPATRSLSP